VVVDCRGSLLGGNSVEILEGADPGLQVMWSQDRLGNLGVVAGCLLYHVTPPIKCCVP
jgi:hypothetical protein